MNLEKKTKNEKKIKHLLVSLFSIFAITGLISCNRQKLVTNQFGLMTTDNYFSDKSFNPLLRFSVCSDVHIGNTRIQLSSIVSRMCEYTYNLASNSNYKNLDAVLFAGDIADQGSSDVWKLFKDELDSAIKEDTMPIVVMGNHDFRCFSTTSEEEFSKVFNVPTDRHEIINGFHFISLSPTDETSFSEQKVKWLDQELEKAANDDPTKPIFVMQHMAISNTVVGSENWGVAQLTSTLEKYPQVIDFSGHSHFPMKDPRSIHQGSFTSLGCGTMFYYELGINGYSNDGFYPTDEFGSYALTAQNALPGAEFYIVEVDANNAVRITGIDLLSKTKICQYGIKEPSNKNSFIYTPSKKYEQASNPVFEKNHTVNATVNKQSIILEIKQAYCKDLIDNYKVEVYKDDKIVNTFYTLSGYYINPMPESVMVTLYGLESNTQYKIDIYAITCLGKTNLKPLSYNIKTL